MRVKVNGSLALAGGAVATVSVPATRPAVRQTRSARLKEPTTGRRAARDVATPPLSAVRGVRFTSRSAPGGEDLVTLLGHRHGVLEVGGEGSIRGHDGPAVRHDRGCVL